jgi:hypothetical protein
MMGFTSLLFECLIELLNILHFPNYKILTYNTNILVSHQEKSVPYYIIMGYMCTAVT